MVELLRLAGRQVSDTADVNPHSLPPFQCRRDDIAEQGNRQPHTDQAGNAGGDPTEERTARADRRVQA